MPQQILHFVIANDTTAPVMSFCMAKKEFGTCVKLPVFESTWYATGPWLQCQQFWSEMIAQRNFPVGSRTGQSPGTEFDASVKAPVVGFTDMEPQFSNRNFPCGAMVMLSTPPHWPPALKGSPGTCVNTPVFWSTL